MRCVHTLHTPCRPLTRQPCSQVAEGSNNSNEVGAVSQGKHVMPFDVLILLRNECHERWMLRGQAPSFQGPMERQAKL